MDKKPAGIIGIFREPDKLLGAIPKIKSEIKADIEVLSPYPLHGAARALGIKKSPLGFIVLGAGLSGALIAIIFQWWTSAVDYPLHIGGKPLFSLPAFIPITFELTVLLSAFGAVIGMVSFLNRLPHYENPALKSKAIKIVTKDGFAILICEETLNYEKTKNLLMESGAASTEIIYHDELKHKTYALGYAIVLFIICITSGIGINRIIKLYPGLPPIKHIESQPKQVPQRESNFFSNGSGMRIPPKGSIARGYLPYTIKNSDEAGLLLVNPLSPAEKVLKRGKFLFMNYCAVCHGSIGDGHGYLSEAYKAAPANLQSDQIRNYPDGKIYHIISSGKNAMPSYSFELSQDDRWSVIWYLRALQESQHATGEEVAKAEGESKKEDNNE